MDAMSLTTPFFRSVVVERGKQRVQLIFSVSRRQLLGAFGNAGLILVLGFFSWSAGVIAGELSPEQAIVALAQQDDVILRVGERLAVGGRAFCAGSGQSAGMTVQRLGQYGSAYRPAAVRRLGLSRLPTITAIAAGGAADAAGLRPGDVIAAIDGHEFSAAPTLRNEGDFAPTAAALDTIEEALNDGQALLHIQRADRALTVLLTSRPACRARFDVRAGRANNASSDGTYVQVSSDLVAQAHDDAEIATILAHELAHNILRHPQRLSGPRPRPRVRDTEIEADRLSVYLLDAARYPASAAIAFWSRWGRANDYGIFADGSHPGWKARVRAIADEATIVAAQRAAGRPVRAPVELAPR